MAEVLAETVTTPRFNITLRDLDMAEVRALKSALEDDDEECDCDGPCSCSLAVVSRLRARLTEIINGHKSGAIARRHG